MGLQTPLFPQNPWRPLPGRWSVKADYSYTAYEGAQHAFTSKDADSLGKKFQLPLAYQEKADTASWNALKDLLNKTFQ